MPNNRLVISIAIGHFSLQKHLQLHVYTYKVKSTSNMISFVIMLSLNMVIFIKFSLPCSTADAQLKVVKHDVSDSALFSNYDIQSMSFDVLLLLLSVFVLPTYLSGVNPCLVGLQK